MGSDPVSKDSIHLGAAAYNANDLAGLAGLCAPTLIIVPFEGWPDDRVYYGPEGMIKLVSEWRELFESNRLDVKDVLEAGERVVALMLMSGVQQGVRVEQKLGGVFDFDEDGRWVRVEYFLDFDAARAAAGL